MKFNLGDINFLEKKTLALKKMLEKEFQFKVLSKKWPISYSYKSCEFVFSLMGSFTVLWKNSVYQKTTPIYHLSVRKNDKDEFFWCDIDNIEVDEKIIAEQIKAIIESLNC